MASIAFECKPPIFQSVVPRFRELDMNPTNTTKKDPELLLLEAMIFGASGSIERQEAQGQAELVRSEVLPTNGIDQMRQMIESNGGSVGEPVVGDEMFTSAVLPVGWQKRATDHSMWSELLDSKGRVRAGIFYKAAHYDRSAHIQPHRRFQIDRYSHNVKGEVKASIKDACGEVEFTTEIVKVGEDDKEWDVRDRLEAEAKAYLDEHFPEWESPEAYWD